ncbi:uncharacterized protein LOC143255065 [Tachypleus tridentatus]|uniref:uncharacterized protein LOC143255065 n=1 Tax=Tachypleus tridentatus TaxID=6853 RepID=UPI003FD41762
MILSYFFENFHNTLISKAYFLLFTKGFEFTKSNEVWSSEARYEEFPGIAALSPGVYAALQLYRSSKVENRQTAETEILYFLSSYSFFNRPRGYLEPPVERQ